MLIFVLVDGGLVMGHYNRVTNAAREGARQAAVGADLTTIQSVVENQTQLTSPIDTNCADFSSTAQDAVCVEWIQGPNGEAPYAFGSSVLVAVKHQYNLVTPLLTFWGSPNPTWTITSCSTARLEQLIVNANQTGTSAPAVTSCGDAGF